MINATAYLRVSSASQDHALQRDANQRAAERRGDTIVSWYVDTESGGTLARPELARLRADARRGTLPRRLYVFALDRLTRTGIIDTLALVRELRDLGVEIISYSDPFDVAGPAGEIVIAVMAWAAEAELKRQKERRTAARSRREKEGLPWGRPRTVPAGDPLEQRIEDLRKEGRSVRYIAQALSVKRDVVHRTLKRLDALSQKSGAAEGDALTRSEGVGPPHDA